MSTRIGFVGLGNMGRPMAERLLGAGFALAVADRDPARVQAFAGRAAAPASLAELGRASEFVITILPDGEAVRGVVAGPGDCVADGLGAGSVVIDMSSASPVGTRALGQTLAARGIALVDAPVSGGVKRAEDGSLAIMTGGDPAVVERCRPVLAAIGKQIFLAGSLSCGHAMKALNNYVSAAGLVAASEAVAIGRRFGLDPAVMVDILNASTGRNNSTENKLKQQVLSGSFGSGFGLSLMAKDLRTALELAEATATPVPLAAACIALWNAAEERLGQGADHTEIARLLGAAGDRS
jgi:3-hydroxyisobutyrate dehydrogenase